jgi:hypothetical protein
MLFDCQCFFSQVAVGLLIFIGFNNGAEWIWVRLVYTCRENGFYSSMGLMGH